MSRFRVISSPTRGSLLGAVLTALLVATGLSIPVAPASALVVLPGASAASWPTVWTDYTMASGARISDVNNDMNPTYLDLASGACAAGSPTKCTGPASTVAFSSDGTNAFFRMRMAAYDNNTTSAGGLFGGAFLVQLADANGTPRAVVGVDGTDSSSDYVYVAAAGASTSAVTKVYAYPFTGGSPSSAAMRWTSVGDATGQFFLDFQVPISAITTASGNTLTASTPIKMYYGSSAAAALSTVNKDFMLGDVSAVDFTDLGVVKLFPPVVTFDSRGGTAVASQTLTGSTVTATEPTAPTRSGYTFEGWYTAATGGSLWSFGTTVSSNLTLYARWAQSQYTVSFDSQGGTAVGGQTVVHGGTVTQPTAPTRAGYTFQGWHTAATGGTLWDFSTPVTSNATLYAQWTKNQYAVSFDSQGGSAVPAQSVAYQDTVMQPSAPTRAGYTFQGWYTAATGGTLWDFSTPVTSNATLYAQWTKNQYTVSFDSQGGTAVGGQTVVHGGTVTQPTAPTRTGYTFGGWYTAASGGTQWSFGAGGTQVTANTTLYARWTKNLYTVVFDSHGGSAVADQPVAYGETVTKPAAPTRTGYTFEGWFTAATGGTQWNFPTGVVEGDTTLHAQWTKNQYTVVFDSQGGTAVGGQTVVHGGTVTQPSAPTRTGYTFDGWWTTPSTGGSAWDFDADLVGADTTLYARWTTTAPSKADLRVTKSVDDPSPRAGEVVTYTLTVTNDGPGVADDVVLADVLPPGVTLVSAAAPCSVAGATVSCAFGSLASGASRTVTVLARVDALPPAGSSGQHWIDVQKTEAQLDLEPGQQRSLTVSCMPGYVMTDGSGRIDHVDQDTGTLASPRVTESRAVGLDTWQVTAVNTATGRAQAKVFGLCVKKQSEVVNGHSHELQVGDVVSETKPVGSGQTTATLSCAPGQVPVQPGYQLDGTATVPTSYPDGDTGWKFAVGAGPDGTATSATFTIRCLERVLTTAAGHSHELRLDEVRQSVVVQPGQVAEVTLSCAGDAKGIVAGFDLDHGLVNLGNDPRPIVRVFKLFNPNSGPLGADLWLLCQGNRTTGGEVTATVVNTASATTSTTETSSGNNSDTAQLVVDTSPVPPGFASLAAPTVQVNGAQARASVQCAVGASSCEGKAVLVASRRGRFHGVLVRRGAVLAKATYRIAAGREVSVVLKPTKLGRKALRSESLKSAKLRIDGKTKVVRLRH